MHFWLLICIKQFLFLFRLIVLPFLVLVVLKKLVYKKRVAKVDEQERSASVVGVVPRIIQVIVAIEVALVAVVPDLGLSVLVRDVLDADICSLVLSIQDVFRVNRLENVFAR